MLLRMPQQLPPLPPTPPPGCKLAGATLEPAELQDLADGLGDILKTGARLNLRFVLRVELAEGSAASDKLAQLNEALTKVSKKLRLA